MEIAIKLDSWYKQANSRGVTGEIETETKKFRIGVETEHRKDEQFREAIDALKEN